MLEENKGNISSSTLWFEVVLGRWRCYARRKSQLCELEVLGGCSWNDQREGGKCRGRWCCCNKEGGKVLCVKIMELLLLFLLKIIGY